MFKFSYNWLVRESEIPVDYEKLMLWLSEQGFEIASLTDLGDDKLIEIEVKANRPDMLCVAGVLREYYCACNMPACKEYRSDLGLKYSDDTAVLGHKIVVDSSDVHRYYALGIKNIDNFRATPKLVADALEKVGVALVCPAVDISNYVMMLIGQPTHIFDADNIEGDIVIKNAKKDTKFITLLGTESVFPAGTVFISDSKDALCVAGIIGGKKCELNKKTRNIIIEAANFDHIIERWASKKSHVTTLASYRYERGVSVDVAILGLNMVADMITDVCGGQVEVEAFGYSDGKEDAHTLDLSVAHTNKLLGSNLSADEIKNYLERCYFKVVKTQDSVHTVAVPSFRLDIDDAVDLIEEVGRMYGYHNIVPQAINMGISLVPNSLHMATKCIRNLLVGYGGIECLTYGFIPGNAMELLEIGSNNERFYGDIKILNPLSNYYSLMRPTMVYSLVTTAIDNVKSGCKKINIFEVGKTYFRDPGFENGYNQRSTVAALLCGINQPKGFGIVRDNMYTVYDILAMLKGIMDHFNIPYSINKIDVLGFLKPGAGGYIVVDNDVVGCVGVISKALLEKFGVEKIVNSDILYFELDYDGLIERKKQIRHNRLFVGIKREYNFIVPNGKYFVDYKEEIFSASPLVIAVKPIDVYTGKGVEKGTTSVLVEVEYSAYNRAVDLDELSPIEDKFYESLQEKYGIVLKQ